MDWNKFLRSIKRKWESNEEEFEENYRKRKRDEEVIDQTGLLSTVSAAAILESTSKRKPRGKNIIRNNSWWTNGVASWTNAEFKKRVRINRETFEFLLEKISPKLEKNPDKS